jgi:hypothetical protein
VLQRDITTHFALWLVPGKPAAGDESAHWYEPHFARREHFEVCLYRSMEHGALANTAARLLLLADSDLPAMFAFAPLSAIVDVPIVG